MQIIDQLLTHGAEHGRTGQALTPKGVTVHYVANPGSTAAANRMWFENGAGGAHSSAHYIIGLQGEIIRCIPENERAQHAGKSYAPTYDEMVKSNNSRYLGIECCHPDASGRFSTLVYASLTALCADICRRYGFAPMKDIVRHYDISGKSCPLYYVNQPGAWEILRSDIQRVLSGAACETNIQEEALHSTVKVCRDNILYTVKAENTDGSWYLSIEDLGGLRVKLRDVLNAAGYQVSWDEASETVFAVP